MASIYTNLRNRMSISCSNRIIYLLLLVFLVSCSPSKRELYRITDSFVESLQTTYESYGIFGGYNYKKVTSDGRYQVVPVGRLINVKILEVVSDDVYEELKEDLKSHYKNDKRVNGVYINRGGTIMIDCRK